MEDKETKTDYPIKKLTVLVLDNGDGNLNMDIKNEGFNTFEVIGILVNVTDTYKKEAYGQ